MAKTATGKACNECKTLHRLGPDCAKMFAHKCFPTAVCQTDVFLIPVVRNNKRSPGNYSKTSELQLT